MSPHGLASELQSPPNRRLSLCQVTLDSQWLRREYRKVKVVSRPAKGKPAELRPRLRRERGKERVVRRKAKPIGPADARPLALLPQCPAFFFREAFSSRWDKTRNRSTAASYGDGAKGTKLMCPNRVGLFPKHTLKTLGFLRWKNACAPRGAHGCAEREERCRPSTSERLPFTRRLPRLRVRRSESAIGLSFRPRLRREGRS
jgi:hypothetical protein